MKASCIVPAFNAEATLPRCLAALDSQTLSRGDYEVIVVDDGSDDGTLVAAAAFGSVRVVRQGNKGPASARNRGLSVASAPVAVFIDADCCARADFLEQILAPLEADHTAVGCCGRYGFGGGGAVASLVQLELEQRYELSGSDADVRAVGGYAVAYRVEALRRYGGFDTRYRRASGEDFALGYRLTEAGGHIVRNPYAVVDHEHPASLRDYFRIKVRRGYWRILTISDFPRQSLSDRWVPRSLVVQLICAFGLAGSLTATLLGYSALERNAFTAIISLATLYLVSMLPLLRRIASYRVSLVPLGVVVVAVRTLGLALGVVGGLIVFGASGVGGRLRGSRRRGQRRYPQRSATGPTSDQM